MKRSLPSQLDIKVRFGILNISLLMGLGPVLNGAYNASKARVRLFTKVDTLEFTGDTLPISTNPVHPSSVETQYLGPSRTSWRGS